MNKVIRYNGEDYALCYNYNYGYNGKKYQLMEKGIVKWQIIAYVNNEEEAIRYLKNRIAQ